MYTCILCHMHVYTKRIHMHAHACVHMWTPHVHWNENIHKHWHASSNTMYLARLTHAFSLCTRQFMYTCTKGYIHSYKYLYISKYTYVHVCIHEYMHIHMCVYIYTCMHIYIHKHIYIHIYVCICICIYICMYIMCIVTRNHFQIRGYLSRSKVVSGGQATGLADRGVLQSAPAACVCCFSYGSALIYYRNPTLKLSPSVASAAPIARLALLK